jgi:hypothetical protein
MLEGLGEEGLRAWGVAHGGRLAWELGSTKVWGRDRFSGG